MNQAASYDYPPRRLTAAEDAEIVRLTDRFRLLRNAHGAGRDRAAVLSDLDDAMEQAWIVEHEAGVSWRCEVNIDNVELVLPWARQRGFSSDGDRRRLVKDLARYFEGRLRDGGEVPHEGITLRSFIIVHRERRSHLASETKLS